MNNQPKLSLKGYKPKQSVTETGALRRADFAGVSSIEAARRVLDFVANRTGAAPATRNMNEGMVRRVLDGLHELAGADLGTVTRDHLNVYRQWMEEKTQLDPQDREYWTPTYAGGVVIHWNSVMRQAFGIGDHGRQKGNRSQVPCTPREPCPAEELVLLGGFIESARVVDPMTEADLDLMRHTIQAATVAQTSGDFRTQHWRRTFLAFFETLASLGCRYASATSLRASDIDFTVTPPRVVFPHMKNMKKLLVRYHGKIPWPRLAPHAAQALRDHIEYLRTTPLWTGDETLLFQVEPGLVITNQGANDALARMAVKAGIERASNCHAIRAAVGTIIGHKCGDPQLGADHLLIDLKTFNLHYYKRSEDHQDTIVQYVPQPVAPTVAPPLSSPVSSLPEPA